MKKEKKEELERGVYCINFLFDNTIISGAFNLVHSVQQFTTSQDNHKITLLDIPPYITPYTVGYMFNYCASLKTVEKASSRPSETAVVRDTISRLTISDEPFGVTGGFADHEFPFQDDRARS
jgi:hypothetical protein